MKPQHSTPLQARGFSLVELLVGIVVAMAAVLVVTQVFRLSEGQRLTIPPGVIRSAHNAQTMRPYNAAEAIGDVFPSTPIPQAPPKKKGCGIGQIFLAIIGVAVAIVTAGAAVAAISPTINTIGARITAIAAGTTGLSTAALVGIGAGSAALGSVVSQGIGVATGDSFFVQEHETPVYAGDSNFVNIYGNSSIGNQLNVKFPRSNDSLKVSKTTAASLWLEGREGNDSFFIDQVQTRGDIRIDPGIGSDTTTVQYCTVGDDLLIEEYTLSRPSANVDNPVMP